MEKINNNLKKDYYFPFFAEADFLKIKRAMRLFNCFVFLQKRVGTTLYCCSGDNKLKIETSLETFEITKLRKNDE